MTPLVITKTFLPVFGGLTPCSKQILRKESPPITIDDALLQGIKQRPVGERHRIPAGTRPALYIFMEDSASDSRRNERKAGKA